jgi:general secretion pathway protein E
MKPDSRLIGEILKDTIGLKEDQVQEALELSREKNILTGQALMQLEYIGERDLIEALGRQFGISVLEDIASLEPDQELLRRVPVQFAKNNVLMPISVEDETCIVAISDPLNTNALDDLKMLLSLRVRPVLAESRAIFHAINRVYEQTTDSTNGVITDLEEKELSEFDVLEEPEDILYAADEAPIIRLVNYLMFQAVKERASDIHIEPFERDLIVRYRIDGVLYNVLTPPKRAQASITSRIKIMAGLNIAEKRLPQDGRIRVKIAGRDIDIRISVLPTIFGERVVMRLLDKSNILLRLEDIGISKTNLPVIDRLIHMNHGIILVTGPTGSGKTTTLYAALSKINSPDKNIITVEDPIEYQLQGVSQIQVNTKINLTFANGLRSILRQDPDVILVGEIRDTETAEMAIQAALTGHLVFSTLHTNDAPGAITRLIDMGVEPFLVSSTLIAIVAQRLVRLNCPHCMEAYEPDPGELGDLGLGMEDINGKSFYRPKGCPKCLDTGYRGRSGIYEFLLINDEIRQLINNNTDTATIRAAAIKHGMVPLRKDGAHKVIKGVTSSKEILRVTQEDIAEL